MATIITKVVAASGGDYTSLSGWEAGEQGDLPTLDEIHQAQCNDFVDTTKVVFLGWVTDATRYWRVFANDDHGGVYSTSVYEFKPNVKDSLKVNDLATTGRMEGIQILCDAELVADTGQLVNIGNTSGEVRLEKIIWRGAGATINSATTKDAIILNLKNTVANICVNSLFYDWIETASSFEFRAVSGKTYLIYNCTLQNVDQGVEAKDAIVKAKNVAINDVTTDGFLGTFHADSTNNASDITSDAPGSSPQTGEITFENEAGKDLRLASSDTVCKENGADLSADAGFTFSDDIEGKTRPIDTSWDISASEAPTSGVTIFLPLFPKERPNVLLRM